MRSIVPLVESSFVDLNPCRAMLAQCEYTRHSDSVFSWAGLVGINWSQSSSHRPADRVAYGGSTLVDSAERGPAGRPPPRPPGARSRRPAAAAEESQRPIRSAVSGGWTPVWDTTAITSSTVSGSMTMTAARAARRSPDPSRCHIRLSVRPVY